MPSRRTSLLSGIPPAEDYSGAIRLLKRGMPYACAEELRKTLNLSNQHFADLIDIPRRTLSRRAKEAHLTPIESEKVLRFIRIVERANELFGDTDDARRWLNTPDNALDGRTPLEYADTGPGAEFVMRYLSRLEHGIPT